MLCVDSSIINMQSLRGTIPELNLGRLTHPDAATWPALQIAIIRGIRGYLEGFLSGIELFSLWLKWELLYEQLRNDLTKPAIANLNTEVTASTAGQVWRVSQLRSLCISVCAVCAS